MMWLQTLYGKHQMTKFTISVDENQARTISQALDLYTRICLGQFEEIERMVRLGCIPAGGRVVADTVGVKVAIAERIADRLFECKEILGHPRNGSWGIFSEETPVAAKRCYEIQKVIDKAVAISNNPNPKFKGANYDGLWTRLTDDPAPVCEEIENG